MKNKILFVPPHPWYLEAHAEYLIRYLGSEFFMEVAPVPYPPYAEYLNRFPNESPFMRNPDEYDLLVPLWPGHWGVPETPQYARRMGIIYYEPNEASVDGVKVVGATTPLAEKSLKVPHHKLRFGVDTSMFYPNPLKRTDNLLHVGMVGTLYNPRRMVQPIVKVLKEVEGIRIMLFPTMAPRTQKELDELGGDLNLIVGGAKTWAGLPNVYNQLDVLIRCEQDPGYSFPVLEASACGVPSIVTDSGIDHLIVEAGGGVMIPGDRIYFMEHPDETAQKVKEAVIKLRDNPDERLAMGINAHQEIRFNWTWDKFIEGWRAFFREGLR